jgi:hypothetical protein
MSRSDVAGDFFRGATPFSRLIPRTVARTRSSSVGAARPARRCAYRIALRKKNHPQAPRPKRRLWHFAEIDAVNVGKEDVARRADDAYVVLDVQRDLEVVSPVASRLAVVGQYGIVEEDAQPVEIGAEAIQYDDIGRDQQKITRERRICLVKLMKIAPSHQQRKHFGFACAGGHLDYESRPVLVEHIARYRARCIEAQEVELVACAAHVVEPNHSFDRFALGEVVAELALRAVRLLDQVIGLEPPAQERTRCGRGSSITRIAPGLDLFAHLRHQRRQQLFIGCAPQFFGCWKPPQVWGEYLVRRSGEIGMQCHIRTYNS